MIKFKDNERHIQVLMNGWNYVASIDKLNGDITYFTEIDEVSKEQILAKMKELQNEKQDNNNL